MNTNDIVVSNKIESNIQNDRHSSSDNESLPLSAKFHEDRLFRSKGIFWFSYFIDHIHLSILDRPTCISVKFYIQFLGQ